MEYEVKSCPYEEYTKTALSSLPNRKLDHLEFIFQQRLSLFNTRRDHEWRIFFGVVFLLGAVDYFLLTAEKVPKHAQWWWTSAVVVLYAASFAYQWGVQTRNHADRCVMDAICQEICTDLPITNTEHRKIISSALDCSVGGQSYREVFHLTYLWAFWCEMLVLLVACLLSIAIPFVNESDGSPNTAVSISRSLMKG